MSQKLGELSVEGCGRTKIGQAFTQACYAEFSTVEGGILPQRIIEPMSVETAFWGNKVEWR